jgi:HK97 family phage major capsid protein
VTFADDEDATLRAKTLTAYDSISRELDEDSLVALEPFFAEVFGDAIAKEENNQLLLGSGSPFTGITDAANTKDITNTANGFDVAYDDLVKLMFGVDGDVVNNGTFVMSMAFLGQVVGIKATTTGAPLFASAWGNGGLAGPGSNMPDAPQGLAGYIMGRPVYVSNTLPTVSGDVGQCLAVYGDFGHAIFGDRRSLSIEIDDSVFFNSRQRCLLAYERIGILIHGTAANPTFARLNEIA